MSQKSQTRKFSYGWVRSLPDIRDKKYNAVHEFAALPPLVDLRPKCPPIRDQSDLGCCVGFGTTGVVHYDTINENPKDTFDPSPLYVYYNARYLENTVKSDSGAQIRDGIKALKKYGCASETDWPYNIKQFAKKPPKTVFTNALKIQIQDYFSVQQNEAAMKSCLAEGHPIVLGISVYESFESDAVAMTGIVPMPNPSENLMGGHCVVVVGYRDADKKWIMRNSWGNTWGDKGYFYLDYSYLLHPDLASDFWTIRFVKHLKLSA